MKVDLKKLAGNPELAGLHNLPDVVEVPNSHLDEHIRRLNRQHPEGDSEMHRVRAIAHYLWTSTDKHRKGELQCAPKAAPDESTVQVHVATQLPVWCRRFAIAVLVLLGLILAATLARAQGTSQIDVIGFQNNVGSKIKVYAGPFSIRCDTGLACTALSGNILDITASGSGGYFPSTDLTDYGSVSPSGLFGSTNSATTPNGATCVLGSTCNITLLVDSNGNATIKSVATASAVDYLSVTNGAAGNPGVVTMQGAGSDTSVAVNILGKGPNGGIDLGNSSASTINLDAQIVSLYNSGSPAIIFQSNRVANFSGLSTVGMGLAPELYNTAPAASATSITTTTMISSASSTYAYTFYFYLTQTAVGSACSGNTTIVVNLIYTDPNAASAQTITLGTYTVTANGTVGHVPFVASDQVPFTFRSKASQSISFSTTYTEGSGCTTGPTVQLYPVLFEE